jgi:hypothetical protein
VLAGSKDIVEAKQKIKSQAVKVPGISSRRLSMFIEATMWSLVTPVETSWVMKVWRVLEVVRYKI